MVPGVECRRWMLTEKKERSVPGEPDGVPIYIPPEVSSAVAEAVAKREDSEIMKALDLTPQDESIPRWDNP